MRRPFLQWHRWFGIVGGAWLFVIALTGSIIVFEGEIDHTLNDDLFYTENSQTKVIGPDQAALAANRAWPGFAATHILYPRQDNATYHIYLTALPGNETGVRPQAFIDPYTGQYLGGRDGAAIDLGSRGIVSFIYKLHHSLHAGETVEWLLGVLALIWLLDHIPAVVLSFPNLDRWRQSFRIRSGVGGHKRVFDLHRAVGLWLLPVTAMLAFSGVYFNWQSAYNVMVSPLGTQTPRADQGAPELSQPLFAPTVSFAEAHAKANNYSPGIDVGAMTYAPTRGLYLVRTFDQRDIIDIPQRMIAINARDGRLLSDRHMTEGSAADLVTAWQFPLHSGKAFGWWGRIAIFLTGIGVCVFVVTGFAMWNRKRKARVSVARKRAAEHLPQTLQPAE